MRLNKYKCPFCKQKLLCNKDKKVYFCEKCVKEFSNNELEKKTRRPSIIMILLFVVVFIVFFKVIYNIVQSNNIKNKVVIQDVYGNILNDFKSQKISSDECTKQLYYALYDSDKLNKEYEGINNVNTNNLINFIDENYESISDETLFQVMKKFLMMDVYIGQKEEAKFSLGDIFSFNNVYATTEEMKVLDKVKLSNDKKFLIWYTTTGKDKVSENSINDILNSIDSIVENIENEFDLKYIYTAQKGFSGNSKQLNNMKKLLKVNNISESYLETAMNIYVVDSGTTPESALAQYLQSFDNFEKIMVRLAQVIDKEVGKALSEVVGVPILPYFNIKPAATKQSEDLNLICAHELSHHFQRYIAGNGKLGNTKAGDFTTETVSNYIAASIIQAKNKDNCISNHASIYVSKCDQKLDTIGSGYANVSFAKVYEEIVPNGKQKVLDSVSYKETLKYFYDVSDGKFEEVIQNLAIRNVTNDYDNNTFKATVIPNNRKNLCDEEIITYSDSINPVAMHYYFINTNSLENNIKLCLNQANGSLSYILIGKKNGKYIEIEKNNIINNTEIQLYNYVEEYSELVICIVNSNLNDSIQYTIEKKEIQIKEESEIFQLIDSIEFKVKDIFDFLSQVIEIFISYINQLEKSGLLESATNEVDILRNEANLAQNEMNNIENKNNNVKLNEYKVLPNNDYNYIHNNINEYLLNKYLKIFEKDVDGIRYSFGVSVDNGINMYFLITSESPKEGILLTLQLR